MMKSEVGEKGRERESRGRWVVWPTLNLDALISRPRFDAVVVVVVVVAVAVV